MCQQAIIEKNFLSEFITDILTKTALIRDFEPLPLNADDIHLFNGVLKMNGSFSPVRSYLNVSFNYKVVIALSKITVAFLLRTETVIKFWINLMTLTFSRVFFGVTSRRKNFLPLIRCRSAAQYQEGYGLS